MRKLENCNICPRNCSVNRYEREGYCRAGGRVRVSKAFLHMWEEPCISGTTGSGTVFFSNCNLSCIFCQNHHISHGGVGKEIGVERLLEIFIELQNRGANNINLVTPSHFIPQIKESIILSKKKGLVLPIVYNSNAYEKVESLRELDGLIDIYLPDIKYFNDKYSIKYSNAPGYFSHATSAVLEMFRQVGVPKFEDGMMKRGLMIRHLMLPGLLFDSKKIVDWVSENLPKEVYLNIMSQYTPMNRACEYPELSRKLNKGHYESLIDYAMVKGIENGYFQDFDSAREDYVPSFDLEGI